MTGDLTIGVAVGAGLLSFLSPCVLPLVPAYLGQLTAVAIVAHPEVGARSDGDARRSGTPMTSRWVAIRHAIAYVAGFGLVFTFLGITATFLAGPLVDELPLLREIGGALLILLGLNVAGVLRVPALERTIRPLEAGASASLATTTGTVALTGGGMSGSSGEGRSSFSERLGGRIVGTRGGWLASLGLGAIFAVGWTPCVGPILGGILGLAATSSSSTAGAILLLAYTAGLGLPFIAIAAIYDRAPMVLRPLVRHGQLVSWISGALVVAIGVAMLFNWLALLPQFVPFNSAI